MAVQGAHEAITQTVTTWPGITAHPHRFGGTEYRLGERREIGHIHGDELVDIPFPAKIRDALVFAGRAELHHIFPKMGAISFWLREGADVQRAIALLRESYELALEQQARRKPTAES